MIHRVSLCDMRKTFCSNTTTFVIWSKQAKKTDTSSCFASQTGITHNIYGIDWAYALATQHGALVK